MRRRHVLMAVAGIAAAVAVKVLYDSSDEILTAADTLTQLRPGWVVVALLAEVASYLLRGRAQSLVLRAGMAGLEPGTAPARLPGAVVLSAGTLAGDAAAYCLPMGFAASGVIMIGVLRRRGVDAADVRASEVRSRELHDEAVEAAVYAAELGRVVHRAARRSRSCGAACGRRSRPPWGGGWPRASSPQAQR